MTEQPGKPSRRRWLAFLLVQVVVFGGLFVVVAEVGARYLFGFRPVTHAYFIFESDPVRGWRHRAGAKDVFVKLGFQQPIEINSRGLREREIPYEKPPGRFRVLCIGDSNTASFEVPPQASWLRVAESVLQERGYDVQFINGGHRAYGTDQVYLFLREEGMKYDPDLVLYFWSHNDIDDARTVHRPYRKYGKGYFVQDQDGDLELRGVPVPRFPIEEGVMVGEDGELDRVRVPSAVQATLWVRDNIIARSAAATALVYAIANLPDLTGTVVSHSTFGDFQAVGRPEPDDGSRLFRLIAELLREMKSVAADGGARFRMIGTPDPWKRRLHEVVDTPALGVYERFRGVIPEDPHAIRTPFDPHWNALGHRLYGEQLAEALIDHGLVPGSGASPSS